MCTNVKHNEEPIKINIERRQILIEVSSVISKTDSSSD